MSLRDLDMFLESVESELQEAVDLGNAYEWKKLSPLTYEFKNKSGDRIWVGFEKINRMEAYEQVRKFQLNDDKHPIKIYDVDFGTKGGSIYDSQFGLTGSGDALNVVTTVMDIILDFYKGRKSYENSVISFGASSDDEEAEGKEPRRMHLYRRFIDRAMRDVPELKPYGYIRMDDNWMIIYQKKKNPNLTKKFGKGWKKI
jgi:hypothetical protein